MKARNITTLLMLLACLNILGQTIQSLPVQERSLTTANTITNDYQQTLKQLQIENETLKKQLDQMEKEIELYREDVRAKVVEMDEKAGRWINSMDLFVGIIGILVALIGIGAPFLIMHIKEKGFEKDLDKAKEELKKQIESAQKDANSAKESVSIIENFKDEIEKIKDEINRIKDEITKEKQEAKKAAKKAKESELFAQALNEKEPTEAIKLYNQVIELSPHNRSAYNNRGNLKMKLGKLDEAMEDYNKAIELEPNNANRYITRAKCYKLMANGEKDVEKKTKLEILAATDEKKAESLTKE